MTDSTISGVSTGFGSNFNTFLKILTTQLTHQDPTSATDTNQFTQELVQFSQVEQQINMNDKLTQLINLQTSNSLSSSLGYIGNYVQASTSSNQLALQDGKAEVSFSLPSAAASVTVKVLDSNNNVIRTMEGSGVSGTNYATWDGKKDDGTAAGDGAYSFTVVAANGSGDAITVSNQKALARVTALQTNTDGTMQLICGNLAVSDKDIDGVFSGSSLPAATFVPKTTGSTGDTDTTS